MRVDQPAWLVVAKVNKEKAWATSILARCSIAEDRLEENRRKRILKVNLPISVMAFGDVAMGFHTDVHDDAALAQVKVFQYSLNWRRWHSTREALVGATRPYCML